MPRRSGYVLYFVAVGLGFMLLEISFLQRFGLYLGYPTYTISVVLSPVDLRRPGAFSARRAESALTAALAALVC
jgi:hypothetical protein